ncbi:chloramphenicol phosphotransferase [Mesorhizobium sp. M7A.F.Ca.CA.001.07.2.1]|jgi:chloramphenicol 3-O phosphotransferase|uniref:chloramphenicol phosphotransferase CPT family protein n=1 Tax=Mesorhizobium TaxID=68287 RepID=UPI000FCC95F8|nr:MULTISPECIES: chloramphenicol phosphotransferase [Mesorhizobium]RVB43585.1 chloramphenicol phosphotransferase [Mesorhizobium sp. M7A.F.Ca.CA.004.05.1.1]MCF6124209.1 chloramphenicol phosphotransferase [Mesorhizobium ciceri]MCQ8816830.1 chloramphenicol phosphotransferase [Mesorhizobium sp. SEMIA396]MCQ8872461.1 chloramphenicol phosphotransferase [Mesorhizobium sp. LMG17149]RUX79689.1 chloramphenicol phosphotransferase [Mesorhizobium sp. M7A.F.Ca.CA.004.08.2.1]
MSGQIIILNGAPRSGKTSIARAVQERFDGVWINLGVDVYEQATPARYRPGIGLRPGGERPDLEALVPGLYAALYESIAAHSRLGLNVVADIGHHDAYSRPLHIVADCARRLVGLPVLFVGVRCPLEIIMERRAASAADKRYVTGSSDDPVPLPVRLWQEEVHRPGVYDLEVDTSLLSPKQCADTIAEQLRQAPYPTTFQKLSNPSSAALEPF